jgi:hypothetical protein
MNLFLDVQRNLLDQDISNLACWCWLAPVLSMEMPFSGSSTVGCS